MKRNINFTVFIIGMLSIICGCAKDNNTSINNIIFNLAVDNSQPLADGTTIVNVTCDLGPDATTDRRNILFTCSAGKFIATKDTSVLSQQASFVNNVLVASVKLIVPQTSSTITITAQPDLAQLPNNNYIISKTLAVGPSLPANIKLSSNTLALGSNYAAEAAITGTLTNKAGGKVSLNTMVKFRDYLQNGSPANGTFRATVDTTAAASTVSTFYSVGAVAVPSKIFIVGTIVSTGKTDTLFFNINK